MVGGVVFVEKECILTNKCFMEDKFPEYISGKYEIIEVRHATAILKLDFPNEYQDIINLLTSFTLKKEEILTPGGRKSPIANKMDNFLYSRGWVEKSFNTSINIDGLERTSPTHAIDCYKNKIALNLSPGDIGIFRGREHLHWREACEADSFKGILLHYFDYSTKNGNPPTQKYIKQLPFLLFKGKKVFKDYIDFREKMSLFFY